MNIKDINKNYLNSESCFKTYLNKELSEYKHSLELLSQATFRLGDRKDFSRSRFMSAYYFMSTSRTQLMAAMDNLNRYTDIKKATFELSRKADDLKGKIDESEKNVIYHIKKQNRLWGIAGSLFGALVGGLVVQSLSNK